MDTDSVVITKVFVVLFGGLIGLWILSGFLAVRRNNAQPVRTVLVQIVSLNKGFFQAPSPFQVGHDVKFQAEDGKTFSILVTDDTAYYRMVEGMCGILTFRGWTYIKFVRSDPAAMHPISAA